MGHSREVRNCWCFMQWCNGCAADCGALFNPHPISQIASPYCSTTRRRKGSPTSADLAKSRHRTSDDLPRGRPRPTSGDLPNPYWNLRSPPPKSPPPRSRSVNRSRRLMTPSLVDPVNFSIVCRHCRLQSPAECDDVRYVTRGLSLVTPYYPVVPKFDTVLITP